MTAVEKIDDYGFGYCYRLETIIFPDTLKTVKAYAFFSCLSLINITIPDSLTSIENYAFNYCPNLATIFYQGTEPFTKSSKAFDRCNSPAVCVSPDFESDKFCGESVSSNETCVTFQGLFNKCYKGAYINGDFVQSKRKNATEWENQTTNCVEFVCDNSSGPVTNDKVDCSQPRACHVGHCNESTGDCEFEKIDGWQELSSQENECYEVACDGNGWVVQKRKNATEWEAQRSQCVDYICDNSSGFVKNNKTECNAPPSCHKSDGYCDEESGKCEYSKTEEWYELISKENECYEVACDGNEWIVRKRKNATEWESETNECFEYMCNNDSGRTAISLCNNSAGVERMCIDGKCIEDKKLNDMKWSVEIKFDDEIKPEDVMISELMENIVSISGVDKNTIEIGIEVDDDGNIIRVIVYTNDKDAAMKVSGRASEALKSNKCGYGVLCRAKIGVKPPSQNLLSCCIYEEPTIAIPVMTFLMAMLKMFV